jgi:hypothetical protein
MSETPLDEIEEDKTPFGLTYYTIIGKDLDLFKWHYDNVMNHGGLVGLSVPYEFLVIIYTNDSIPESVTKSIVDFCEDNNISYHIYAEPDNVFLTNLYNCWNLGYEHAKYSMVFRGGSDQAFNRNGILAMWKSYEDTEKYKVVLQANTVECASRIAQIGAISRHFTRDFGDSYKNMNIDAFDNFVNIINARATELVMDIKECLKIWQKPTALGTTLGSIFRCDGCSWLMSKEEFDEFGPLIPIHNGVTGDVYIHDKMQEAGYEQKIVRDCCTYHIVQGERT